MKPILLLLLQAVLLLSCAQKKLVPVENGVKIDKNTYTALYEDENVTILVKANAWEGDPADLTDYVLPLYIEIKNRSTSEIELESLLIVDDLSNQFNALGPKEVAEIAKDGSKVGVSVGLSYGVPYWSLGWAIGGPYWGGTSAEVVEKALIPGKVLPGNKVKGFVYFQKPPDEANRITLRLGYKIGDLSKSVEFKFKVEDGKGSSDNGNKEGGEEGS